MDYTIRDEGESDPALDVDDLGGMAPHGERRVKYLVEKILDTRRVKGEKEYLILWQDYDIEDASWEKAKHCECPDAIAAFYRERRAARFSEPYNRQTTAYTLRKKEKPHRPRVHRTRSSAQNDDSEGNGEISSETQVDQYLYKIQSGRRIEALLAFKSGKSGIQYMVRYRGTEPKEKRTEFVPSSVLREYAMEEFADRLEQVALANCEGVML